MDELFQQLEERIRGFEQRFDQLHQSNLTLKENCMLLKREKILLLTRYKKSMEKIEKTLARLKSIEGLL